MVLDDAVRMVLVGLLAGVFIAAVAERYLQSQRVGFMPNETINLGGRTGADPHVRHRRRNAPRHQSRASRSQCRPPGVVSSSRFIVDIHHIDSTFLRVRRRITVMRPRFRDRDAPQDPPAVLYLNDGQNLFDPARAFAGNTWRVAQTVNWLAGEGRIPPILVVGIDHGEVRRAREYLPVEDERNPSRPSSPRPAVRRLRHARGGAVRRTNL